MRKNSNDIRQYIIRLKANMVYYFDNKYIYSCMPCKEAENCGFINFFKRDDESYYIELYEIPLELLFNITNLILFQKCICMLNLGDNLDTLKYYCKNTKLESNPKLEGLNRFITKIDNPDFSRIPENPKPNTFDYIIVFVNVVKYWDTDKKEYIKKHINEINELVINKIKNDSHFQKYGIPISFLKLANVAITIDSRIKYVFELKEV